MLYKEYTITNRITQILQEYDKQDMTNGNLRARRMLDVRAYARDLFKRGYMFREVKYYVAQVTSPFGFGVSDKALREEEENAKMSLFE